MCATRPKPLHIFAHTWCQSIVNHCWCATYLSSWPWIYFRSGTRSQQNLVFLHTWYTMGGTLCVPHTAQTASHICTYLVPINCTIIVDAQHTFYFDLDLISEPGGHKNLVFFCMLYLIVMNGNCHFLYVNYMPIIISLKC